MKLSLYFCAFYYGNQRGRRRERKEGERENIGLLGDLALVPLGDNFEIYICIWS